MKSMVNFSVGAHRLRLPGGATQLLETTGCGPDVATVDRQTILDVHREQVEFVFEASDERIGKVLAFVRQHGEDPFLARYYEFTEEERQTAPLLQMRRDVNQIVMAGAMEGTKYDLTNACPTCGTGARQSSPLCISYRDLPLARKHRAIGCYGGAIIVDGGMVKKLRECGVTGISSFGEVYARMKNGGRSLVAREQIIIDHTLPPASPSSTLDWANACKTCHRGGLRWPESGPYLTVYRRQDLADIRDMNLSWEWSGRFELDADPRQIRVPLQDILVTPKVMNIFREAGVKTFEWTPIFVED